jgi:hypothetical protein
MEVAAGLRTLLVDRAETGEWIERDTGAVRSLVHATSTGAIDREFVRHDIAGTKFDHPMTTPATTGARGEVGM